MIEKRFFNETMEILQLLNKLLSFYSIISRNIEYILLSYYENKIVHHFYDEKVIKEAECFIIRFIVYFVDDYFPRDNHLGGRQQTTTDESKLISWCSQERVLLSGCMFYIFIRNTSLIL